jgi:RNA polymerase sigma-70 factor (ECF subfamily)
MTSDQERQATDLMIRAQHGDQLAYAELLTLLAVTARRYTRHRFGDVPWIDDVAQETLVSVDAARRTYDRTRPFGPWFYAILSRRLIDVLRKVRRVSAREIGADVLPEFGEQGGVPDSRDALDVDQIKAALATLPARQREIVSALKVRDESVREIGQRLGMTESAVKVTAHRGYRALRRLLGGRDT